MYRSNLDATRDTQAGLAGPLVVSRPGGLNADGKPADVDREVYLMLQVKEGGHSGREHRLVVCVSGWMSELGLTLCCVQL